MMRTLRTFLRLCFSEDSSFGLSACFQIGLLFLTFAALTVLILTGHEDWRSRIGGPFRWMYLTWHAASAWHALGQSVWRQFCLSKHRPASPERSKMVPTYFVLVEMASSCPEHLESWVWASCWAELSNQPRKRSSSQKRMQPLRVAYDNGRVSNSALVRWRICVSTVTIPKSEQGQCEQACSVVLLAKRGYDEAKMIAGWSARRALLGQTLFGAPDVSWCNSGTYASIRRMKLPTLTIEIAGCVWIITGWNQSNGKFQFFYNILGNF